MCDADADVYSIAKTDADADVIFIRTADADANVENNADVIRMRMQIFDTPLVWITGRKGEIQDGIQDGCHILTLNRRSDVLNVT